MRILLICIIALFIIKCSESTKSSSDYSYSWALKSDSMNFAVLTVDEETYTLDGGKFSHYQLCNNCGTDTLPFDISILAGRNFDIITIKYSLTYDTLFSALAYLDSHPHYISHPKFILLPDTFKLMENIVQKPDSVEYFGHFHGIDKTTLSLKSDSVWNAINSLDIVNDFSQANYQVGFFIFRNNPTYEGPEWVVFLCR